MVTPDPQRTPNFILFANPDYFFLTKSPVLPCTAIPSCFTQTRDHAWNHGDFQREITHTWLGLAGPGVREQGRTGKIFSDHTDIRPTIMTLARPHFPSPRMTANGRAGTVMTGLLRFGEDVNPVSLASRLFCSQIRRQLFQARRASPLWRAGILHHRVAEAAVATFKRLSVTEPDEKHGDERHRAIESDGSPRRPSRTLSSG